MIGQPGVGRSSFVNTFFSEIIVPSERQREAERCSLVVHRTTRIEGGVRLDIEITEVLGFSSPAKLADSEFTEKLLDHLKSYHLSVFNKEHSATRHLEDCHDDLIHAVLYFIPPTFSQFTKAEMLFFKELQKLSIVVPIISKADMYTSYELEHKKMLVPDALLFHCSDRL